MTHDHDRFVETRRPGGVEDETEHGLTEQRRLELVAAEPSAGAGSEDDGPWLHRSTHR